MNFPGLFLPRPKRRHGARLGPFGQRTAAAGAELRRAARRPAPRGLRRHGTGTNTPAPARTRRHNGARAVLTIGHDDARGLPASAAHRPHPQEDVTLTLWFPPQELPSE